MSSGESVMEKRNNRKRTGFGETDNSPSTHRLTSGLLGGLELSPRMAPSSTLVALCKSSLESHNAILNASLTRDGLGLKLLIPP